MWFKVQRLDFLGIFLVPLCQSSPKASNQLPRHLQVADGREADAANVVELLTLLDANHIRNPEGYIRIHKDTEHIEI